MCAASMPLDDSPHLFWAFPWWNGSQLSLTLNYLTIILRLRFPLQTLMATNSKPVLHNCNRYQYFSSLAAFLPEVSFPPAVLFNHLCWVKKILCILSYLCVSATLTYFEPRALSHREIPSIPRLRTAAVGCRDVELKCEAYVLACSQGKINILPCAHLVIFNLDMKQKLLSHTFCTNQGQHSALKEIICGINRELLGRPVSSHEV